MCETLGLILLWLFRSVSFSNWIEVLKLLGAAVKLAMGMLDGRKKEVALYKYSGENDFAREVVEYAIVANALSVDPEKKYDRVHSAVREIFERFLEFLARFEGFLATGVAKQTDLNPYLDYWVRLIAGQDAHAPEVTEKVLPSLWKFIDYYGYRDVRRFIGRYETVKFPESGARRVVWQPLKLAFCASFPSPPFAQLFQIAPECCRSRDTDDPAQ